MALYFYKIYSFMRPYWFNILLVPLLLPFRISLLGLSLLTSITGLVSASARNFTTLLVLRTLAGIGTGGTQVYTTWFMEFVPVANRGTWMIFFFVTGALGTSIEALIAWVCA